MFEQAVNWQTQNPNPPALTNQLKRYARKYNAIILILKNERDNTNKGKILS